MKPLKYQAVLRTRDARTNVSGSLRCLQAPSIKFQIPGAAPPEHRGALIELSLADAVHQLNASDRDRRVAELLEPEHHSDALLDTTAVPLNQVTGIFRRLQFRLSR
jgi:hypothetical protein